MWFKNNILLQNTKFSSQKQLRWLLGLPTALNITECNKKKWLISVLSSPCLLLRIVAYSVSCLPNILFQILCNTHTHVHITTYWNVLPCTSQGYIILYWKSHLTDFFSVVLVSASHCWATYLRHIWRLVAAHRLPSGLLSAGCVRGST